MSLSTLRKFDGGRWTEEELLQDNKIFDAPRPNVLNKSTFVMERVLEVVGYRNRSSIHSLSDLNDPHFAEGEWLALWQIKDVDRSQTDWLRHDVCMKHIAPLVEKYVMKLYDLTMPQALSMMAGYFSSIDDVKVQEILFTARNNMYMVEIASLSESFVNEAIHPQFSNNIIRRFEIEYNSNDNAMYALLPRLLVKYAYPDLVSTFNAEVSRRQTLCGHKHCKPKRCWANDKRRFLKYQFVVQDEPDLSEVGQYTTIVRPSEQLAQSAARCDLTSATVATVGTCCCMRKPTA